MGSNSDCCIGMGKFLAFLSFVTFLLHAAGVANPYWLEKEFSLPIPGVAGALIEAESHVGLLWACNERESAIANIDDYKCESLTEADTDQVADWQWVSAGLGIGALVGSFVSVILSCCIACQRGRNMGLRATVIFCYFIACALFVAVLVLFNENKEITVLTTPIEFKVDYNLDWGYYVAAVASCMLFVMSLFHMFVACGTSKVDTIA